MATVHVIHIETKRCGIILQYCAGNSALVQWTDTGTMRVVSLEELREV